MVFKAEFINIITEILQSLQICQESSIPSLIPLLPAYRITLRAIKNPGEELPKKDLQWCEKLRTIAPPEESIPLGNHSTANVTTECDAFATPVNPITEDLSTADITSREDASATRDTSTAQDSSTVDATSEDATSEDATSEDATSEDATSEDATSEDATSEGAIPEGATPAVQDTSAAARDQRARKNIAKSLTDYEVIKKFKEKAPVFETWTSEPRKFWTPPAIQELQLPESTIEERYKVYYEHVAEQKPNIEALNLIQRFDSVIAYFRFKQWFPLVRDIRVSDVETFVETIGILKVHAHKYHSLLLSGRRRVQFCHFLSKGIVDINTFWDFCHDDVNFHDLNYGVLFIEVDDRIWDSRESRFFKLMKFFVEELQSRNITEISKKNGAELAAKALLHSRQAFLGNRKLLASSDAEENSSTVESRSAPPNDGENDVTAATTDEVESNTTAATSNDEGSDSTVATSDEVESNTTVATSDKEEGYTTVATSDEEEGYTTVATSDEEEGYTTAATTDEEEGNTTVATSDEVESNTTVATSDEEVGYTKVATSDKGESNTTATSKRSHAEIDWDGTDSDDTRASKRSCKEAYSNNTITSEGGRFQLLVEAAVEVAGQNATASETTIANLASGVDTMHLNYAGPPNSQTGYLNSVDLQGGGPEEHNTIAPSVLNNNTKPDASLPNTSGFKDMATSLLNGDPSITDQFFVNGQAISLDASFEHMATPFPNGDPPITDQFFVNGQTQSLNTSSPNTNTHLLSDAEFVELINDDALLSEFLFAKGKPKHVDAWDTNTLQTSTHNDGEPTAGSPVAGERF